jgi:hypothetical protein
MNRALFSTVATQHQCSGGSDRPIIGLKKHYGFIETSRFFDVGDTGRETGGNGIAVR